MNFHEQNAKVTLQELCEGLSPEESINALKAIIKEAEMCIECHYDNLDNQLP